MPVEYYVFASKFIKFNDISNSETVYQMMQKMVQNQEILDGIYDLKSELRSQFNLNPNNLSLPQKFFIFFEKIKK